MDAFVLIVVGGVALMVLAIVAIGHFYPGSGADVLDWKPTRSMEDEAELEMQDIAQMIEAQNERRRRDGRPEISEEEFRARVERDDREMQERAARYRKERP